MVGVCIAFHRVFEGMGMDVCVNLLHTHLGSGHSAPLLPRVQMWQCHCVPLSGTCVSEQEPVLVGRVSGKGQENPDRVRGEGAHRGHGAAPQQRRSGFRSAWS